MEKPAVKNYSLIKNDPFNKQPKLGASFDHKKVTSLRVRAEESVLL